MLTTEVPSRERLVERAAQLGPILRKHAAWAEENRRQHDETIEALADAGIFKMRVPARYGGYESDTRTLVDVGAELGRADGSPSWVASVYWIPTWMTGLFPDAVQDEVFATPDVRICGTLSPTAMAAPAEGGIIVNGKWGFITGAQHAQWQEIVAVLVAPRRRAVADHGAGADHRPADHRRLAHLRPAGHRQRQHRRAGPVRAAGAGACRCRWCCRASRPRSSTPARRCTGRRCCRLPRPRRWAP